MEYFRVSPYRPKYVPQGKEDNEIICPEELIGRIWGQTLVLSKNLPGEIVIFSHHPKYPKILLPAISLSSLILVFNLISKIAFSNINIPLCYCTFQSRISNCVSIIRNSYPQY